MRLFLSLAALLAGCAADDGPSDDASGGGSRHRGGGRFDAHARAG